MPPLFAAQTRNAFGALRQQAHFRPGRNIFQKFGDDVVDALFDHGAELGQQLKRFGVQFGMRAALQTGRGSRRFRRFEDLCSRRHASSSE